MSKGFREYHSFKAQEKLDDERTNFAIKCKCGKSTIMTNADRTICSWCGHWIYRTKEIEFKYKLREELIKNNRVNK